MLDHRGYVRVYGLPGGWEYEHRLVAGVARGRSLTKAEAVHHRNEIRSDNRPANLAVMKIGAHVALHNRLSPKRSAVLPSRRALGGAR